MKSPTSTSMNSATPSFLASSSFIPFCSGEMLSPTTLQPYVVASSCEMPPWPEPRSSTTESLVIGHIQSSDCSRFLLVALDDSYTPSVGLR